MTRHSQSAPGSRGARVALAVLAAATLALSAPAGAVLYKWIDANGRVSYSDQPPPANVKAEIVNGGSLAAASAPDAVRDMAGQEMDLKKREKQRVEDQKKAEKARADAVAQEQACSELRARIRLYESDQNIARVNEKGETVYLDDTMKNLERERLVTTMRERCPG
jgi:hypothetical protein